MAKLPAKQGAADSEAFVFLSCGQTAPDVALLFVEVQDRTHLGIQGRIAIWQTLLQIFVHSGFGNTEVSRGSPDRGAGFDDVHSKSAGSFLYGLLHGDPSDAVWCHEKAMPQGHLICKII